MSQSTNASRRARRLELGEPMTIVEAVELKARLERALAARADLEADLAGVPEIDTAGLQVLLAARREAERRGARLRLCAPSPAVAELAALYGLADHFETPAAPNEETAR